MGRSRGCNLRCGLHPFSYSLYMTLSGWLASSAGETCIWVLLVLGHQHSCCFDFDTTVLFQDYGYCVAVSLSGVWIFCFLDRPER